MAVTRTGVLVIGAGPYGIAVAHDLWIRGLDFAIVGEPFELWHRHTLSSMTLRSGCGASEIYARDRHYHLPRFLERGRAAGDQSQAAQDGGKWEHSRIPVTTFRHYLDEVAERLPFEVYRQQVIHLDRRNGHFRALGSAGLEIEARSVVVATGLGSHRYLPPALRELSRDRLLHAWQTPEIEQIHQKRVLVIGGGQSAAETVAHLLPDNEITWALRHKPLFMSEPLRLPTPLFRAVIACSHGLYRLPPPMVRALGKAVFYTTITPDLRPTYTDRRVQKLFAPAEELAPRETADGIRAGDGTYDRVVAATGYRFALSNLAFLSGQLRGALGKADQPPVLDNRLESSVENLYMIGGIAESTFGPAMRFIFGSRAAARHLGRHLAKVS